jgi:hypothetical protein
MTHVLVAVFLALFLVSGWGVAPSRGQERGKGPEKGMTTAMDLMDLDIPGEGSGDEMELPPIQGKEKREAEPAPPAAPRKPAQAERSMSEVPEVSRSVKSPKPGLNPFLLEEPEVSDGTTRVGSEPAGEGAPEPLPDEIPAELKTVSPAPSHAESLKLPAGTDAGASGSSEVPEIPLLKGEDQWQQAPAPGVRDSPLTMKPLPDLRESSAARPDSSPSRKTRRPEDTLQVREDIDARLIHLFERFYKDR